MNTISRMLYDVLHSVIIRLVLWFCLGVAASAFVINFILLKLLGCHC